ncbi:hypothetical protein OCH239_10780 [Roseivivax halodurans JCM 10272]|uniref:Uncharacterized protein n=1 Tax=Roseivivax halodurans JCM 10272 TaxID=1449350 RepID=X7EB54_9RHOB|nr:hypothetical protein [Roseivivax halodurans]ETX13319.1 hypothetical protein OCH239_10780 [Roseivivax halodurans JCM 10272]
MVYAIDASSDSTLAGIRPQIDAVLADMRELTDLDITFDARETGSDFRGIGIIELSRDLARALDEGAAPGLRPDGSLSLVDIHDRGGCIGTLYYSDADAPVIVPELGVVFLNDQLTGEDRAQCLWEEMAVVFGLRNDPPEQASLFDGENFRDGEDGFGYSKETEAMLAAIYEMARRETGDIATLTKELCNAE